MICFNISGVICFITAQCDSTLVVQTAATAELPVSDFLYH